MMTVLLISRLTIKMLHITLLAAIHESQTGLSRRQEFFERSPLKKYLLMIA